MKIINQYSILELKSLIQTNDYQVLLYGAGLGVSSYSKILIASLSHNDILPKYQNFPFLLKKYIGMYGDGWLFYRDML